MVRTKINGMSAAAYKLLILKEDYPQNLIKAAMAHMEIEPPVEYTPEILAGIECAIKTLSNREQNLLYLRYAQRKTLKEIGEFFGVSPERVSQIERAALRHLRKPDRWKFITNGIEVEQENIYQQRVEQAEWERTMSSSDLILDGPGTIPFKPSKTPKDK